MVLIPLLHRVLLTLQPFCLTPIPLHRLESSRVIMRFGKLFVSLAATLDAYNNGLIGPGHCDGEKTSEIASGSDKPVEGINIFPNPVSDYGTIEFTANRKTPEQ
jgi:hypothetical protein